MSDIEEQLEDSVVEIRPTGGRLQRAKSTDEDNQKEESIIISDQSDLELVQRPVKSNADKPKKPRKKRNQNINAANIEEGDVNLVKKAKKPKEAKQGKSKQTNDKVLELLHQKAYFQTDEAENHGPSKEDEEQFDVNREIFGIEQEVPLKKQKAPKASNINNLIKNRHKFFSEFEENQHYNDDGNHLEEEAMDGGQLNFQRNSEEIDLSQKDGAQKQLMNKVNQYKQKLALFTKPEEEQPIVPVVQAVEPEFKKQYSLGLKRTISMNDDGPELDPDIELFIPKIKGAKDSIVEATLFFNKLKQQGLQKTGMQNSVQVVNNGSKSFSRSDFLQVMKNKCNQQRQTKSGLSLNDMMNRFQNTTFEQMEEKKPKPGQGEDTDPSDEDVQFNEKQLNEESESIQSGTDEDDDQKIIDDKVVEDKRHESEIEKDKDEVGHEDSDFEVELEQNNKAVQEEKQQQGIEIELQTEVEEEDEEDEEVEEAEEQDQENKQESLQQPIKQQTMDNSESEVEEYNEEDAKMFSRLRKISQLIKSRKQKQHESEVRRLKRAERQQEMNRLRKMINGAYVETQAELGSDNESHDDVIKKADNEEEDEDDEVGQELEDLIDNNMIDINEEDEQRAYRMFMDKLHDQEKEDLRKILKGEFRGRNGKVHTVNINDLEQTEAEKAVRFNTKQINYQDDKDYDSDEYDAFMNMDDDAKKEFIREKRLQKILYAQKQMNIKSQQLRRNEMELFDKEVIKAVQSKTNKPIIQPKKQASFIHSKIGSNTFSLFNQNSNNDNSNSVSVLNNNNKNKNGQALNRLFAQNMGSNGGFGQQIKKSPCKMVIFGMKKQ